MGLLASLHVKAAVPSGGGFVEVDFNDNPMRSEIAGAVLSTLSGGRVRLCEAPGIGIGDEALAPFSSYRVWSRELRL